MSDLPIKTVNELHHLVCALLIKIDNLECQLSEIHKITNKGIYTFPVVGICCDNPKSRISHSDSEHLTITCDNCGHIRSYSS